MIRNGYDDWNDDLARGPISRRAWWRRVNFPLWFTPRDAVVFVIGALVLAAVTVLRHPGVCN